MKNTNGIVSIDYEKSFTDLYRLHFPDLCNFANRYVRSNDLSEEIVQDVFLNIWRCRFELHPNDISRAYLFKSVRNKSLDYLKHRKVELKWEKATMANGTQSALQPDEIYHAQEFSQIIQEALNKLPESRKTIFLLSREHELTYREIAQVLGISIKTVETQMGRSLKALRQVMQYF